MDKKRQHTEWVLQIIINQIGSVKQKIQENRVQWFGYVEQIEDYAEKIVKKLMIIGKRKQERLKLRWNYIVTEDLKEKGWG